MKNFIVASSKDWHAEGYREFVQTVSGRWAYVSDKTQLLEVVNKYLPRYVFFLHWNWLVPAEVFSEHECICFHMTDVPYGRGGSPLQNLILKGHKETKLSALRMVREMDAGPVYCKRSLQLHGSAKDIYLRAGEECWEMIRWIVETEPEPEPQVGEVTIFKRRTPAESELPKSISMKNLYDFIRMLDAPTYPSAFLDYGDYRCEVSEASLRDDEVHARVIFKLRTSSGQESINE